jgi:glucosamine--fructose-6-phosphate aminotransferase (isomerizing)
MAVELIELLAQLEERGAELVVISALERALELAQTRLLLPSDIPEWISPLVTVVPGQVFALGLTLARGLDPDHPRGLRKVTLTE